MNYSIINSLTLTSSKKPIADRTQDATKKKKKKT